MYLFPIVGIVIGLVIGSLGYGLSLYLEPLVVSLVVVASLAVITGIHHTDGLADFADGLMTKGTKEKKKGILKKGTDKNYKSISSYKPTGNLIYNTKLIQKIEDVTDNVKM